jgi:hypothetical protein
MNPTILIALSSTLTAIAGVTGIFFSGNEYVKYISGFVIVISTLLTILQAIINQKSAAFTTRALSNLIRAVQPSELVREAIISAAMKEGTEAGLPISHVIGFESHKYLIEFYDNATHPRGGILCLHPSNITELSLHDANSMKREMSRLIWHKYERKTLDECWKDISDEIVLISELIFDKNLQKSSTVKLWAHFDNKYLAVGPPDCPDDTPPSQRAEFPEPKLQDLLSLNTLKRGAVIGDTVERLVRQ